jgi:RsmE family RNA methyltransferase
MRLHRFFIEQKIQVTEDIHVPDPSLVHQLRNVFRLQVSDQVVLLDNSGLEYLVGIVSLEKEAAVFHVKSVEQNQNIPKANVILFQSLIKKDKFEWVVEKTTELGVNAIVPILSERSEKKTVNSDRCHKIAKEASEQSGRGRMPKLYDTMLFSEVMDIVDGIDIGKANKFDMPICLIAFDPRGEVFDMGVVKEKMIQNQNVPQNVPQNVRQNMSKNASQNMPQNTEQKNSRHTSIICNTDNTVDIFRNVDAIGVLIGPEGGWSVDELKFMQEKGVLVFSLGKQVLRAETAAISIVTLMLLCHST